MPATGGNPFGPQAHPHGALVRDIRRAGGDSRDRMESRIRRRLEDLVAFARRRSPFYRDRYAFLPRDPADVRELPPVSKRELMSRFDDWATDPEVTRASAEEFVSDPSRIGALFLGRYVAFTTSGTTGTPAVLLHDRDAMAIYRALLLVRRLPSLIRAETAIPFLRNRARVATIIATGGHFASSVVDALVRSAHPGLYRRNRTFSLMRPVPELVRELNGYRPAILGSYPTALAVLAAEQDAGRLRIDPALILAGAERLSPSLSQRVRASFRCPVRDTYAASEFMGIAYDCRFGRLHLNADWVILEPVDAAGNPVSPGEASATTYLTNLANRIQPLIRYDLGDSVTPLPGPCPCGSPLPGIRPEGRRDETLHVARADGSTVPLLPLVLGTVIEETAGVLRYQMLQTGPGRLRLRVEEAPGCDRNQVCLEAIARLRTFLSSRGLEATALELAPEKPVAEAAGGKLRQFFTDRRDG